MKNLKHSLTWNKDSNELFDYECSDVVKNNLAAQTTGYLVRLKDNVEFISQLNEASKSAKLLVKIDYYDGLYYIVNEFEGKNNSENAWLSLRYLKSKNKNKAYTLNQGDLVKMGRIKFKVRDIKLPKSNNDMGNLLETRRDNIVENNVDLNSFYNRRELLTAKEGVKSNPKRVCRICYCDEKEVESPLLNPCNCSGGVKYIHLSCLQQWLKSKCVLRSTTNANCVTYTIRQVECEICKQVLPDFVKYDNKLYEIWDFVKPTFTSYITMETLVTEKDKSKNLYILSLDEKTHLKIGRSHDADLRITDISVSRFHAQITKNSDNTLSIEDNFSKFGSLVLLQNPKIPVHYDPQLTIQVGRSVLTLNVKQPFKLFSCFKCGESPDRDIKYNDINHSHIQIEKILSVKLQNNDDLDFDISNSVVNLKESKSKEENSGEGSVLQNNIITSNNEDKEEFENINQIAELHELNHIICTKRMSSNYPNYDNLNFIERENSNNKNTNFDIQLFSNENLNNPSNKNESLHNKSPSMNLRYRKSAQNIYGRNENHSPIKIKLNAFKKYEEDLVMISEDVNIVEDISEMERKRANENSNEEGEINHNIKNMKAKHPLRISKTKNQKLSDITSTERNLSQIPK